MVKFLHLLLGSQRVHFILGRMDFNKILEHFRSQAAGKINIRKSKNNLIIVDAGKKTTEDKPKLQVIIPAEAATKIAESELKEDIKVQESKKDHHSVTNSQRGKRLAKRKTEEVKDIFNKKWRRQ